MLTRRLRRYHAPVAMINTGFSLSQWHVALAKKQETRNSRYISIASLQRSKAKKTIGEIIFIIIRPHTPIWESFVSRMRTRLSYILHLIRLLWKYTRNYMPFSIFNINSFVIYKPLTSNGCLLTTLIINIFSNRKLALLGLTSFGLKNTSREL